MPDNYDDYYYTHDDYYYTHDDYYYTHDDDYSWRWWWRWRYDDFDNNFNNYHNGCYHDDFGTGKHHYDESAQAAESRVYSHCWSCRDGTDEDYQDLRIWLLRSAADQEYRKGHSSHCQE